MQEFTDKLLNEILKQEEYYELVPISALKYMTLKSIKQFDESTDKILFVDLHETCYVLFCDRKSFIVSITGELNSITHSMIMETERIPNKYLSPEIMYNSIRFEIKTKKGSSISINCSSYNDEQLSGKILLAKLC